MRLQTQLHIKHQFYHVCHHYHAGTVLGRMRKFVAFTCSYMNNIYASCFPYTIPYTIPPVCVNQQKGTVPENDLNYAKPALHGSHHQASSSFRVLQLAIQALLLQQQLNLFWIWLTSGTGKLGESVGTNPSVGNPVTTSPFLAALWILSTSVGATICEVFVKNDFNCLTIIC